MKINQLLIILYFTFFVYENNAYCFSQDNKNDIVDTNYFLITKLFSNDTLKTINEIKMENTYNIYIKQIDYENIKLLAKLISNSGTLFISSLYHFELKQLLDEISIKSKTTLEQLFLDLPNNDAIPEEISKFENLNMLFIYSTNSLEISKSIYSLIKLVNLSISGNRIINIPKGISNLNNLIEIRIEGTLISKLPEDFSELKKINNISLTHNENLDLKDVFFKISKIQNNIEHLDLSYCKIDYIPNEISLLKNVKLISLWGNNITKEELLKLEKKYPNILFGFERDTIKQ